MSIHRTVLVAVLICSLSPGVFAQNKGGNPFGTTIVPEVYNFSYGVIASVGDVSDSTEDRIVENQVALFNVVKSANVNATQGGESGTASAQVNVNVALDIPTSVVTGSVDLDFESATTETNPDVTQRGDGDGFFRFQFTIAGVPAVLNLTGSLFARSQGPVGAANATVSLNRGSLGELLNRSAHATGGNNQTGPVSETLNLEPGSYTLEFVADADLDDSGPSSSVGARTNLSFTITPSAFNQVFWKALDGDYSGNENWEPPTVPGVDKTAIFDRDADYTVTIGTQETGRAILERGRVAFEGGSYTLSGGTEETGSLVVGGSAIDIIDLDLRDTQLNTLHAVIGDEFLSDGLVFSTGAAVWTNQGRLSIGKDGTGRVRIENNASLSTAELRLGDGAVGSGTLTLRNTGMSSKDGKQTGQRSLVAGATAIGLDGDGALVVESAALQTGAVEIGSGFLAIGTVTMTGEPAENFNFGWIADSLTVGKGFKGSLSLTDGNGMRVEGDISMGNLDGESRGVVTISGHDSHDSPSALVTFNGKMTVGGSGFAELIIEAGAFCRANNVVIGDSPVGDIGGLVCVRGKSGSGRPSELNVTGETLQIGRIGTTPDQSTAFFAIEEGAEVICVNAFVGFQGGENQINVQENCKLTASGGFTASRANLTVDPPQPLTKATIFNHGLIEATRIVLEVGTEIFGNGLFSATDTIDYAGITEPAPPVVISTKGPVEFGVITFDGDFNMERGEFRLDVGGAGDNQSDGVLITGDANITGGTINFNFVNGFLPQTGETIPFLQIDGAMIFENIVFTYTGAAEGFEFTFTEQNGMLMIEALNDAQPLPTPNADLNGDNEIDAKDLLIFIERMQE